LPLSVGAIVQNTTTCVAIADAVVRGIPVIDKVLTVSGAAVVTPRNVLVRIGTSWRDVLAFCGGPTEDLGRLVMGGPMMGVAQNSFDAPVIKASSGLLALSKAEVAHPPEGPCLRCGMCVSVCPMARKPLDFPTMAELHLVSQADAAGILECIECGTCEYACPANRPILQSIQVLKAKVRAARAQTAATR
jgi:electron transport complex protein RnfC